jgi:hypothetical protein
MPKPTSILAALLAGALLCTPVAQLNAAGTADAGSSAELDVSASALGVEINLTQHARPGALSTRTTALIAQRAQVGDTIVPGRIVALHVTDGVAFDRSLATAMRDAATDAVAYTGALELAPRLSSEIDDGVTVQQRAAVERLPKAPLTILRDGRYRDQRVVTLAISQLFEKNGARFSARSLNASLAGASIVDDVSRVMDAPASAASISAVPNPAPYAGALSAASWIRVTKQGLHQVSAGLLGQAGLNAGNACVTYKGAALALHEPGDGSVIFNAQLPGDRYNSSDVYWLINGGCPRMQTVSAPGASGSGQTSALERGRHRPANLYYSLQPGNDGDHWFAAEMKQAFPELSTWAIGAQPNNLPGSAGNATFTIRGVTRTKAPHTITLSGNGVSANATFEGNGQFETTVSAAASALPTQMQLTAGAIVLIDEFLWDRPVQLNFSGGGAGFLTPNAGVYQLSNPSGTLYDVTDPVLPKVVQRTGDGKFSAPAFGNFIMGGPTSVTAVAGVTPYAANGAAAQARNKRAFYIVPAALAGNAGLAALVSLRNQQGWNAEVITLESLYALWSHGHVSPDAIRKFLQFQYANSSTKPEAVILIGDGNYDWRGILDNGLTFARLLPPYMADVDRFRGEDNIENAPAAETACDPCYAQLDGNSPLDDPIPDLIFGRMPVQSDAQLTSLTAKIVRYETLQTGLEANSWRHKIRHLVDNYWKTPGEQNIIIGNPLPGPAETDPAGPFWAFSDHVINRVHAVGPFLLRAYYDPYGKLNNASYALAAPQPNDNIPGNAGKAAFNFGASFIVYIGHSNEQRMGKFEVSDAYANAFLYDFEVQNLTNVDTLPIVLQMTCLTGSFHKHAITGQSDPGKQSYLDEALVLQEGNKGAIATWSSTGLGVMYGHQPLLSGFFTRYWSKFSNQNPTVIGDAATAGYLQLHTETGTNAEDSLRTYSILGDPLTRGRAFSPQHIARTNVKPGVYLPLMARK